jgi:hypothetical protein
MDQSTQALALILAAIFGLLAILAILRRQRRTTEADARASMFGTSTEGLKRCPNCGFGNLVTDQTCSSCGKRLPG